MALSTPISAGFLFDIALGRIPGYQSSVMVGTNPDTGMTEETVWDQGGLVSFLSVAETMYISSTSAADTTQFVLVAGVDNDWNNKTTITQLNGQNQVSIGSFLHVQSATIVQGTIAGNIYVATTSTLSGGVPNTVSAIKTKIIAANQTSNNGWIIIPTGKTAAAVAQRISIDETGQPIIHQIVQRKLNQPVIKFSTIYVAGSISLTFPIPIASINVGGALSPIAPEKTIIEFRAFASLPNTLVSIGLDYILADKNQFLGQ